MKKMMFSALVAGVAVLFSACGGSLGGNKYDTKSEGLEKALADIKKTVGEDGMMDELRFSFDDDAADKNTTIEFVSADFQSKSDKNQLQRISFNNYTGWSQIEPVEITVTGNAENFSLDDEVNSISLVKAEVLKKVYEEALKKAAEERNDVLFSSISIDFDKDKDIVYNASLDGKLKNNGVKKSLYLKFDKDGNLIEK